MNWMQSVHSRTAQLRQTRLGAWLFTVALVAVATGPFVAAAWAEDRVVLLDGRPVDESVESIDADGKVRLTVRTADLMGLRSIVRPVEMEGPPLRAVRLYLRDGSVLIANDAAIESGKVRFDWAYGEQVELPAGALKAVLFKPLSRSGDGQSKPEPAFDEALEAKSQPADRLYVLRDEGITSIAGALEAIGDDKVTFVWQETARTVARTKVYGMTFARPEDRSPHTGDCLIRLADGSQVWAEIGKLAAGKLELNRADWQFTLPWKQVVRIDVRSDRMIFLSDLEPITSDVDSLFVFGDWQKDRNFLHRPITLGKKVYERGIGMHSPCSLTYDTGRGFNRFVAVIGIDDQTNNRGDCVFRVLVDGQEKFKRRMRGGDEPEPIRVDIENAGRITLVVDAGEDYDLSDHANWADARFVRE